MNMKVKLLRRLGQNKADAVIETDPASAEWLIAKGHAERAESTKAEKPSDDETQTRSPGRPRKATTK